MGQIGIESIVKKAFHNESYSFAILIYIFAKAAIQLVMVTVRKCLEIDEPVLFAIEAHNLKKE